jgi:hypothetical protein
VDAAGFMAINSRLVQDEDKRRRKRKMDINEEQDKKGKKQSG